MSDADYKFIGWVGEDPSAAEGNMIWKEYKPKVWEETDIDIKVTHSGVCGTDVHTLRGGWKKIQETSYPCVVGHETVGKAVRVGSQATGGIKVGDIVGVGAKSDSCLSRFGHCKECDDGREQYCPKGVDTFNAVHFNGSHSMGGHALYHRCPSSFVIPIPRDLAPEHAAPMLCGGITCYSPLKHWGAGPGKRIAILGVGGLGHMAVMFARAMGAEVVVGISRSSSKKADALKLGCTDYIAMAEEEGWAKKWARSFDLIISTASGLGMPYADFLKVLDMDGTLVQVGAPEEDMRVNAFDLFAARRSVTSSAVGSRQEIQEMFQLAADTGIKPVIELRPMSEANHAIIDLEEGKARFRYVLVA